jgi:hypothetical protein
LRAIARARARALTTLPLLRLARARACPHERVDGLPIGERHREAAERRERGRGARGGHDAHDVGRARGEAHGDVRASGRHALHAARYPDVVAHAHVERRADGERRERRLERGEHCATRLYSREERLRSDARHASESSTLSMRDCPSALPSRSSAATASSTQLGARTRYASR